MVAVGAGGVGITRIIRHRQGHGVGARGGVGVARAHAGAGVTVTEVPVVGDDGAVGSLEPEPSKVTG